MRKLEKTGFDEINQRRLAYGGKGFWYLELAVTGICNFACKYCNKLKSTIDFDEVVSFIEHYAYSLRHVQITGGEPVLYPRLSELCKIVKQNGIKLGLSTNGSADLYFYKSLNVDMFSISLDDSDAKILTSRGYVNPQKIIDNIKDLSETTYVNIGLVIDSTNVDRITEIIDYILDLGVADIKLSVSTKDEVMPKFEKDYPDYPILNYRVERFKQGIAMRGLTNADTFKCNLSRNDISIVNRDHYPCLVYAREGGKPIGPLNGDIRGDRQKWLQNHLPKDDPICRKFCMDFKCEYNRSV